MFDSGTISSTLSWWTPPRLASVWLQSSFWWMPRSLRRCLICKKCIASPHLSTNMTRIGFDFWGAAYSNSQELMAYHFVALRMFAFSDLFKWRPVIFPVFLWTSLWLSWIVFLITRFWSVASFTVPKGALLEVYWGLQGVSRSADRSWDRKGVKRVQEFYAMYNGLNSEAE